MPIGNASWNQPPTRTRGGVDSPAMAELEPFFAQAVEARDGGADSYIMLPLDSKEEAEHYGREFHKLAKRSNRLAQVRYHDSVIYVRVREAHAEPVKRPRRPSATEAESQTETQSHSGRKRK